MCQSGQTGGEPLSFLLLESKVKHQSAALKSCNRETRGTLCLLQEEPLVFDCYRATLICESNFCTFEHLDIQRLTQTVQDNRS